MDTLKFHVGVLFPSLRHILDRQETVSAGAVPEGAPLGLAVEPFFEAYAVGTLQRIADGRPPITGFAELERIVAILAEWDRVAVWAGPATSEEGRRA